jgi:hypothetical protein
MANTGFLIANEFRDYPFLTRIDPLVNNQVPGGAHQLVDLPQDAIVDFGAVMDLEVEYDEVLGHYIYLHSITRHNVHLYYDFRTTAPGGDQRLVFVRNTAADPEFTSEWAESVVVASSESSVPFPMSSEPGCNTPKWRGFLVTGRYADLLDMILDGHTMYFLPGLWQVEPARVQNLANTYVQSFNIATGNRQQATPTDDCNPPIIDLAFMHTTARCLQGQIEFTEGFNCTIEQDDQNNSLTIGAAVGAGAGRQCEDFPLYPGEPKPTGSPFYTGGPSCRQILKSINGKGGRHLQIRGGRGFKIAVEGDTLVVNRSLHDFAACFRESSLSSEGA